jgi:DNA-binding PadR family transcriptional regulator
MMPNLQKIDDAVLALLHSTSFSEGRGAFKVTRAWKGHQWDALDRLHAQGYISDPVGKAKSVALSEAGAQRARDLFERMFCD